MRPYSSRIKEFIKEAGEVQVVIYDISDLSGTVADFVGPSLGFGVGGGRGSGGGFGQ
jgi:hypothetical protein